MNEYMCTNVIYTCCYRFAIRNPKMRATSAERMMAGSATTKRATGNLPRTRARCTVKYRAIPVVDETQLVVNMALYLL